MSERSETKAEESARLAADVAAWQAAGNRIDKVKDHRRNKGWNGKQYQGGVTRQHRRRNGKLL